MNDSADGIATLREVRATFASASQMQDAVSKLSMSGFDRADVSLPSPGLVQGTETPEAGTAAAAAAMTAAGVTVATGGAAAPAVAAAVVAGGAAGGSVFAAHEAADRSEQTDRDDRAASSDLVLAVRAVTEAKRAEAEAILRATGATDIEMI